MLGFIIVEHEGLITMNLHGSQATFTCKSQGNLQHI